MLIKMKDMFIKYLQNRVLLIPFILIAILSNQIKVHSQSINTNEVLLNTKIDSIISILTIEEKIAMCHAQSKFSSATFDYYIF
jgi:beta-glucosidase